MGFMGPVCRAKCGISAMALVSRESWDRVHAKNGDPYFMATDLFSQVIVSSWSLNWHTSAYFFRGSWFHLNHIYIELLHLIGLPTAPVNYGMQLDGHLLISLCYPTTLLMVIFHFCLYLHQVIQIYISRFVKLYYLSHLLSHCNIVYKSFSVFLLEVDISDLF